MYKINLEVWTLLQKYITKFNRIPDIKKIVQSFDCPKRNTFENSISKKSKPQVIPRFSSNDTRVRKWHFEKLLTRGTPAISLN